MNYYLLGKNKKPKGPYQLAQLRDLWKAGKIPAGTLCCEKGGKKWLPIENVALQQKPKWGMAVVAVVLFAIVGWQFLRFTNVFSDSLDTEGKPNVTKVDDLCKDGAHDGKTIVVLAMSYNKPGNLSGVTKALEKKGFKVVLHITPPSAEDLRLELGTACQIWIISNSTRLLNERHLQVIKEFFESGKGVYIWGDNEPLYADANALGRALLEVEMSGSTRADKIVHKASAPGRPGFIDHPITTGLSSIYEGSSIATIGEAQNIQPIIRGSAGTVVTAVYDHAGKRAVIDGAFTRLGVWKPHPSTARFVKNAACWLVNGKP